MKTKDHFLPNGQTKALFFDEASELYFLFESACLPIPEAEEEVCVYSDSKLDNFAFSPNDDEGNLLVGRSRVPLLYGWPLEFFNPTQNILGMMWEIDQPGENDQPGVEWTSVVKWYSMKHWKAVEMPVYPQAAYPV